MIHSQRKRWRHRHHLHHHFRWSQHASIIEGPLTAWEQCAILFEYLESEISSKYNIDRLHGQNKRKILEAKFLLSTRLKDFSLVSPFLVLGRTFTYLDNKVKVISDQFNQRKVQKGNTMKEVNIRR